MGEAVCIEEIAYLDNVSTYHGLAYSGTDRQSVPALRILGHSSDTDHQQATGDCWPQYRPPEIPILITVIEWGTK